MSFGENLQYLRKAHQITQEKLAEEFGVSRQTVSKWESNTAYPEMEKLIRVCEMFSVDMDTLLRGNVEKQLVQNQDEIRRQFRRSARIQILSMTLLFAGIILTCFLESFQVAEYLISAMFLFIVGIAVILFAMNKMQQKQFRKEYPKIDDFYTKEEKKKVQDLAIPATCGAIALIFLGIILIQLFEHAAPPARADENFYTAIALIFILGGAGVFLAYETVRKSYDIVSFNRKTREMLEEEEAEDELLDQALQEREKENENIYAAIMMGATILFLVGIFGFSDLLSQKIWIVYPVAGILCGIVSMLRKNQK